MRAFRKSAVEPIEIELLDGRKVHLRASLWTFKTHHSGLRAADIAALDQIDAMLEFLWDCVLEPGELTKQEFLAGIPLDPKWIGELFAEVVGAASSSRPIEAVEPPKAPQTTGSSTQQPLGPIWVSGQTNSGS